MDFYILFYMKIYRQPAIIILMIVCVSSFHFCAKKPGVKFQGFSIANAALNSIYADQHDLPSDPKQGDFVKLLKGAKSSRILSDLGRELIQDGADRVNLYIASDPNVLKGIYTERSHAYYAPVLVEIVMPADSVYIVRYVDEGPYMYSNAEFKSKFPTDKYWTLVDTYKK